MTARPLSTALKCLDLLDVIAAQPGPVRISSLGRLIGETRATTYQRLLTLTTAGWLERLPDGSYRLSMHACRIANAAMEQAGFGERAQPVLDALAAQTGETCSLVVLEGDRVVIAQRVESRGILRADLRVGAELSYKDSASGKVWLAYGPPDLMPRLIRAGIETASELELERVREDEVAVGGGGGTLQGIGVVAVPILDRYGGCRASMSVVCPETRFDLEKLLPPLRTAAAKLTDLPTL